MRNLFTSPTIVDGHIQQLLMRITSNAQPVILTIEKEPGASFGECFFNVEDKIKKDGGSSSFGWAILSGGAILEAEAHAVWRKPDGSLCDITPRALPFTGKSIMFVEDPSLIFRGRLIDNKRINTTSNVMVDHIIKIAETIMAMQIPCTKVFRGQQEQPNFIREEVKALEGHLHNMQQFVNNGGQLHNACFCRSGKTYINCHGMVEEGMHDLLESIKPALRKYLEQEK